MSKGDSLEKRAYNNTEKKLEGNNSNNKEHLDKNNTPSKNKEKRQETFITIDGEFWEKINELLDSKVEAIANRISASKPKGRKSKDPKTPRFWAEAEKHVQVLVSKHNYVSFQLLQTDPFLMEHFAYPQQWTRLRARLLKNNKDFVQFRLSESGRACWFLTSNWKYKEAKRAAMNAQTKEMKSKPRKW